MFCTGGIRCEKAAVAMAEQGYTNVSQLDGGILRYIAERPQEKFKGECFVFDHRLAVKQDDGLRPSEVYSRCPHCGNGGTLPQTCSRCAKEYQVCDDCVGDEASVMANDPVPLCSKDCRYQYGLVAEKQA